MKKTRAVLIILLVLRGIVSAVELPIELPRIQATNARIMAMGGAFTAVADDANALYYNPAGLVYLHTTDINLGLSLLADTKADLLGISGFHFPSEYEFNYNYLRYDESADVVYLDDNNGTPYTVDDIIDIETDFGFENSWDGINAMSDWYGMIPIIEIIAKGCDEVTILPNLSIATRNVGVGFFGEVAISPTKVYWPLTDTQLDYGFEISKKSGIIAGVGFKYGHLSLGTNLKYYREVKMLFGLPSNYYGDFNDYVLALKPDMELQQALFDILIKNHNLHSVDKFALKQESI